MIKRLVVVPLVVMLFAACAQAPPAPKPVPAPPSGNAPADPARGIRLEAGRFDGQAGIFAKNLGDGRTVEVNAEKIFPTASTHKLLVAMAV